MPTEAVPPDEPERVALLHATRLLDCEPPPAFEALLRLAAAATDCPILAINLVDAHRVWSLSRIGLVHRQQSRADAPCSAVVHSKSGLQIADTGFALHQAPALHQAQGVQAYAGEPLVVEGRVLGTVCAMDAHPRAWSAQHIQALQDAATAASALLTSHLQADRARLMDARMRAASLAGSDWLWETNAEGRLQWVSEGLMQHTGLDPSVELGLKAGELYSPRDDDSRDSWVRYQQARARHEPFTDAIAERSTPRGRITVSISGNPYFNEQGRFMGYRGASRIVTRQIEAEQEAKRAAHLLRQAIESFPISVMISDRGGRVVLSNHLWREHRADLYEHGSGLWPDTQWRLIKDGFYPQAAGQESEFLAWRLALHEQPLPQEVQYLDRWMLIKDHLLPDQSIVHFAMDITQSKLDAQLLLDQQKALSEAKAGLSTVLSALPDLWFVLDAQGRHLDGHCDHPMLLHSLAELQGTNLGDKLPPAQAAMQRDALARLHATGQPQRLEYDLVTKDGGTRHFEARLTAMPEGKALFITRDITELQQASEKLRVSEELYRSVAATISDGLLIVELNGRVVALNPAASRILGVAAETLLNLTSPSLLGLTLLQDDLQTPVPLPQWPIAETLAKGHRVVDRVHALRRQDGEIVWVQISSHLLRVDSQAPPFAAMATLRDITRERHAQQELLLSEERWKFALEGAGDGVWDWDLAHGRIYFSPRWKAMLGHDEHEVSDNSEEFFSRIHPDDRTPLARSLERYIGHGEGIHQAEFRLRHKAGHYLSILSRGKLVNQQPDGCSQRMVGTHSDITPLKQAEKAQRDKQSAEAASAAKTEFLSRMSHEIRTPLNAVSGFAQLLQLQLAQQDAAPAAVKYVEQILQASHHLAGLVNDVLDLQKVEAGVLSLRPEPLLLQDELAQCLNMLAPLADQRRIALINLLQAPWPLVADRQRLRQVIMNICANAIKYNHEGGTVRVDVQALPGHTLALTIEDTGAGMSPQQLAKLFQPFERLGRETSSTEGTGLGLIITRSLIEAMGGHMDIRSHPGAGTRVSLHLPMLDDSAPTLSATPSDSAYPPSSDQGSPPSSTMPCDSQTPSQTLNNSAALPALRVLYVEDNRINAMLFEEALRPYPQIDLAVAEDGEMAMEMAQEQWPDVLVLDAHLPGMSGFEVLRALRTLPQLAKVPAFMCSADAMPEDVARAKDAGFDGYWTKPIDIVAVTTALCRLAERGDNAAP
jgi:PAS domain S-box-containing protein